MQLAVGAQPGLRQLEWQLKLALRRNPWPVKLALLDANEVMRPQKAATAAPRC